MTDTIYTQDVDLSQVDESEAPEIPEQAMTLKDGIEETSPEPAAAAAEPVIEEPPSDPPVQQVFNVCVDFPKSSTQVDYIVAATKKKEKMVAANRELKMITGKIYLIPVNVDPTVNSDNFANIKIFSDAADLLDVRYVKDGIACVIPVQHSVLLKDKTRLCVIW